MAKTKGTAPASRRSPDREKIADAIAPVARRKATATPAPTGGNDFAKLSLSVSADIAKQLRVAAVVEHEVSASALVEVALRHFFALPVTEQASSLRGIGRRRER